MIILCQEKKLENLEKKEGFLENQEEGVELRQEPLKKQKKGKPKD